MNRAMPSVRLDVSDQDRMRLVTILALGGLVLAAVLALIGGLPFDLPMPTHAIGWVEPSCGLTRGSTAIARGDLSLAWRYNPASFLAVAFGAVGLCRAIIGFLTRRWINVEGRLGVPGWIAIVVAIAGLWLHQQNNADFVINSRL